MGRSERSSEEREHPQESSGNSDSGSERSNPAIRQMSTKEKSSRSPPLRPANTFLENYPGIISAAGPSSYSLPPMHAASNGTTAIYPADVNPTLKGKSKANPTKGKCIPRGKTETSSQKRGRGTKEASTVDKNPAPPKKRKSAEFVSPSSSSSSSSPILN